MVVMNTSTGMTAMAPGSPMTPEKAQQLANQQNKNQQNQQQQQQVLMQQQAIQQQGLQQFQFQQGQQHIQPKPMMSTSSVFIRHSNSNCPAFAAMQTIQGIPQQQIQVQAGTDRPVMPVVSMPAQPNNQSVQQAMQQQMPGTIQQSIPLQPNLAVTQQAMQMGMQQIQPVSS